MITERKIVISGDRSIQIRIRRRAGRRIVNLANKANWLRSVNEIDSEW